MLPLFFAYAGFEALAHSGAEVVQSTERLPRILLRGVAVTTQGKLAPVDKILFDGFEAILYRQNEFAPYWARYLATAARVLTNVVPYRPDSVTEMKRMIK